MHTITRRIEFDAGHRVPLHASKCKTPHGHRYVVEISVAARALTDEGFVLDFGVVKTIVGNWVDTHWDHTMLYQRGDSVMEGMLDSLGRASDLRPWYPLPFAPTAENLSRYLFDKANELLADTRVCVVRVRLYETPNCWADWSGE